MRRSFETMLGRKKQEEQAPIAPEKREEPEQIEQSSNFMVVSEIDMLNAIYQQNRIIIAMLEKAVGEN
jgi:hypothetical protein